MNKYSKLFFLFFLLFNLSHCNPFVVGDKRGDPRDKLGEDEFDLPPLQPLDYNEIKSKALSGACTDYNKGLVTSFLPPVQALQRCLHYIIDVGIKPICKRRKDLRELISYYKKQGDDEAVAILEEELYENEASEYDMADHMIDIADTLYDAEKNALEEINNLSDNWIDDDDKFGKKLLKSVGITTLRIGTKNEIGGTGKILDSKARNPCSSVDLYQKNRDEDQ